MADQDKDTKTFDFSITNLKKIGVTDLNHIFSVLHKVSYVQEDKIGKTLAPLFVDMRRGTKSALGKHQTKVRCRTV
jgi:hypothetical protein